MNLLEIFLIGIGLSMDALAVAICKGLSMTKVNLRHTFLLAGYFGVFQGLMPLLGWLLGSRFSQYVTKWAPWIAFILLAYLGGRMIYDSRKGEETKTDPGIRHKELLALAIATSIDALAVGVTFSFLPLSIPVGIAVILIGCTTFAISFAGVFIGNIFGARYESRAQFAGGVILVGIGAKILLEYLLEK